MENPILGTKANIVIGVIGIVVALFTCAIMLFPNQIPVLKGVFVIAVATFFLVGIAMAIFAVRRRFVELSCLKRCMIVSAPLVFVILWLGWSRVDGILERNDIPKTEVDAMGVAEKPKSKCGWYTVTFEKIEIRSFRPHGDRTCDSVKIKFGAHVSTDYQMFHPRGLGVYYLNVVIGDVLIESEDLAVGMFPQDPTWPEYDCKWPSVRDVWGSKDNWGEGPHVARAGNGAMSYTLYYNIECSEHE